ncbi:hypothetical protein EVA_18963 [gut metagenome]|uniref:Uncharacterized protein n=1 Tax=gut metagenome TaxID=749906 RepID=J9FET5_9ZZZZ
MSGEEEEEGNQAAHQSLYQKQQSIPLPITFLTFPFVKAECDTKNQKGCENNKRRKVGVCLCGILSGQQGDYRSRQLAGSSISTHNLRIRYKTLSIKGCKHLLSQGSRLIGLTP